MSKKKPELEKFSMSILRKDLGKLAGLLAASLLLSSQANLAAVSDKSKSGSVKFAELAERFMKESLALSPTNASQAGYHKHRDAKSGKVIELDSVLDDLSSKGIAEQKAFYENWRERFHKEAAPASLNPEDSADWHLIDDQISLQLLEFNKIQNYKHNPTVPVELIGTALFQPLTEDYADKSIRLSHILSRISQIPKLLKDVKEYIDDANPVYIKTAIEENAGNLELIETTIGDEIPKSSPLRAQYERVSGEAAAALNEFSSWLQNDLAKRPSNRSWRLGKELYAEKFKYVMEADLSPEQVLADAESDLKSVRAEILNLALPLHKEYYGDHNEHNELSAHEKENLIISEVLKKISDNHPKREDLQKTIEDDLESIKQFIRNKKIVSLSERNNLKVTATPIFQRGVLSVAAFHSAPALNPKAEAQYWVTPIDASIAEDKAESKLREYNNFTLKWLSIHEALPGHYIQFEHLNSLEPEWRRLLRSLCGNGAYIEGWAEYIAQVMMDEGYMKDDPRFRIIMRKIRLRLLCNAIIDIKMHTQNMSDEEALRLMTKEAFQTEAEAEGKLKRAKLTSTQLPTYYVGLREWLKFREKFQKAKGKNFNMLEFHNKALDEGPLPVPSVESLIMPKAE
ncbi:MAG: DUF885 domain-containing protein [Candidatus Obscuribacterales bacterium]|nr:DUF885 domain-containing protein [Candidatus Obscuribacterales bacterium]